MKRTDPEADLSAPDPGITTAAFATLAAGYLERWPVRLAAVAPDGKRRFARRWWGGRDPASRRQMMAFVVQEALRWGEPTITYAEGGDLFWAVPLMHNAALRGGIVAAIHEDTLFPDGGPTPIADLKHACTDLRRRAERANLTNAALLEVRRWQYAREQERAELLQDSKSRQTLGVRQLYLEAEPRLMAAVRRGDQPGARAVLNQILTQLLGLAGERFALVRSFCLELVATMGRTAVEAGGDADTLLGAGHRGLAQLAEAESLEALAPILHAALDEIVRSMQQHAHATHGIVIANALAYMREHLAEPLSRDAVAEAMCLSPSHFSRLFKQETGKPFGEVLARLRVDQAAELLARTDLSAAQVARACGFHDPSYFSKVFTRLLGVSPRAYRANRVGRSGH
jgi:AraC-like DNA-binding protein